VKPRISKRSDRACVLRREKTVPGKTGKKIGTRRGKRFFLKKKQKTSSKRGEKRTTWGRREGMKKRRRKCVSGKASVGTLECSDQSKRQNYFSIRKKGRRDLNKRKKNRTQRGN